ncbi:MAG: hypothetical protein AB7E83_25810, partial [Ramlibacter sp.]
MTSAISSTRRTWAGVACTMLLAALPIGSVLAAATDLANAPLFTSSASSIKPNIMFILDDSGSMARDYMPDVANFDDSKYGSRAAQCNGLAFNPNVVYTPPVNSSGVSLGNASTTALIADPITQTQATKRTINAITMPASASGSITVRINPLNNAKSSWYKDDTKVTIYQSGDPNRWISGKVTDWSRSTGNLTISLSGGAVVGSGTMGTPIVGYGWVTQTDYYVYTGSQTRLDYTYNS